VSVIATVRSGGHGTQSLVGSVMGTPAYMPPEQARGDVEAMDERSDVFALGAILCEILTGKPPYVSESGDLGELIGMASMAELDGAHSRLEACEGEPEMIKLATRCLMPAPAARPRSAEAVASTVHEHLAAVESRVHEARVEAAEAKVRTAALKRTQKLGISLTAVIAAGLLFSLWFWRAADTAATNEAIARNEAEVSAAEARENELVATRELARAVAIKDMITEMLQSVTPAQAKGADITLLKGILDTASEKLSEGAIEDELVAAELHSLTGSVYYSLGLYPESERHMPVAFELRKRVLGEEHSDTLISMGKLAQLFHVQGRFAEAEPLFLKTLKIQRRVLGEEHRGTLMSMNNLANLYQGQGRFAESESLHLETLEIERRNLGEEHPSTLGSMGNLAILYQNLGRYAEAEPLALRTLEIERRILGEEHPSTLGSMNTLASIYAIQGRHAEAESLFLKTLEVRRRVLGGEHPETLTSMGNLGNTYHAQARYAEAESLYRETIEIKSRVLGEEHPSTLSSRGNLLSTYMAQARYAEAEPLLLETLEIQRRVLGKEHQNTMLCVDSLASIYVFQGRYAEAQPLLLETLALQRRVLGEEHPDTLGTAYSLTRLYFSQRRYTKAQSLASETLEIRRRTLGEEHPSTLLSMGIQAVIYNSQGKNAEAEPLYIETIEIMRRVHGEEHPQVLAFMSNLATLYIRQARHAEAEPIFLEAFEVQRRVMGAEHPDTLLIASNLGVLYNEMERFEEAAEIFETSLRIGPQVSGKQQLWRSDSKRGLIKSYVALGRHDEALPLQREALEPRIAPADDEQAKAFRLNRTAQTLLTIKPEGLQNPERALRYAERACALREEGGGKRFAQVLDTLALAQFRTGDFAAAVETQSRACALLPGDKDQSYAARLAEYEAALEGK